MKRWFVLGLVLILLLTLSSFALAGDRQRGRWEGVAIGLGAVTLYNFFQYGQFSPVILPHGAYGKPIHPYSAPAAVRPPSGHWEIRRIWIPESREKVWIPGHYRHGYWVKGHYEVRVHPGHYVERKLWVEGPRYHSSGIIFRGNLYATQP